MSHDDPSGDKPPDALDKAALDAAPVGDNFEASALVLSAIDGFAHELVYVCGAF